MNERQALQELKFKVDRGLLVQGMQMSQGWKLLEEEIQGMLDAYKSDALSTKYLNDPSGYASLVGAHNALQSLLNLLRGTVDRGKTADQKLENHEKERQEQERLERKLRRV